MNALSAPLSSPADTTPRAEVLWCTSADDLATQVVDQLARELPDPFARALVIVPGPGHARWLSQCVATRLGISAGIDFLSLDQVERRLTAWAGMPSDLNDRWSAEALSLAIAGQLRDLLDEPNSETLWADPLRRHLAPAGGDAAAAAEQRPARLLATATRLAQLFRRYADLAPEMVAAWSAGGLVAPNGGELSLMQQWQARLWQRLCAELGDQGPAGARRHLMTTLAASDDPLPWCRGAVASFGPLTGPERELIVALAARLDLSIAQLAPAVCEGLSDHQQTEGEPGTLARADLLNLAGWRLHASVGHARTLPSESPSVANGGGSLLSGLQQALTHPPVGSPRGDDGSVVILASHALDRQIEVLREHLCGLFDDDPSLEPREVVIVCPDLERCAPLLDAAFSATELRQAHPGHQLRVQAPPAHLTSGPVFEVLRQLLHVVISRASADDLLALVGLEPVARRFGFSSDDLARLRSLLERARVRWGLDKQARADHGLPDVSQGTWLQGIERLAAGVTLAPEPIAWLDTALPIEHVEGSDTRLVGCLAELVSRVRKLDSEFRTPATAQTWAVRLTEAIDLLIDLPWDQQWARSATFARIHRWAANGSESTLDQREVQWVIETLATRWSARPRFGNGSIQCVGLNDLRGVPHRVVAIVGLDDHTFPRRGRALGDDLLASDSTRPEVAERDPRLRSHSDLLAAIGSAQEHLVIIHQASDPRTGTTVEPPVVVNDLAARCAELAPDFRVRHVSLQAHAAENFTVEPISPQPDASQERGERADAARQPFSFDHQAEQAAVALNGYLQNGAEAETAPLHWQFPSTASPAVALADLIGFWKHPIRTLLKSSVGTSLAMNTPETSLQIPLELWGLGEYSVGQTMLDQLLAGADPASVRAAMSLGGDLPPGDLGRDKLAHVLDTCQRLVRAAGDITGETVDQQIDLTIADWQLTGVVRLTGDTVVDVSYANHNGASLLDSWIRLLAASLQLNRGLQARPIHKNSRSLSLMAPGPQACRSHLATLLSWRERGLERPLLAPVRVLYLDQLLRAAQSGQERDDLYRERGREYARLGRDPDWQVVLPDDATTFTSSAAWSGDPTTVTDVGRLIFAPIDAAVAR